MLTASTVPANLMSSIPAIGHRHSSRRVMSRLAALAIVGAGAFVSLTAAQTPPATSAPPPPANHAGSGSLFVQSMKLRYLAGAIATQLLADMPAVQITVEGGGDVKLVSADSNALEAAVERLARVDSALGPQSEMVELSLQQLNPADAANLVRGLSLDVMVAPVPGAKILVLRGPRAAIDAAAEKLALLDARAVAMAHDEAKAQQLANARAKEEARQLAASRAISLDFPGGTVDEYLKAVAALTPQPNIVLAKDSIRSLRVPPVSIKSVTAAGAVQMLAELPFERDGARYRLSVKQIPGDPTGEGIQSESIYVIDSPLASPEKASRDAGDHEPTTQVFSLATIQKYEPAMLRGLLDAITTGVELNGKNPDFSMKFHEGSGLLFVRGQIRDVVLVDQIIAKATSTTKPQQQ